MKITIETIPHQQQRYETVGDWYYDQNGDLIIRVSDLGDWRENAMVGVHELVEVLIAKHRGITVEQVDKFDMEYEAKRERAIAEAGRNKDRVELLLVPEPGDDPACPIRHEHSVATGVERILAALLEVDWEPYATKIEHLAKE